MSQPGPDTLLVSFLEYRPRLLGLAYWMLGSAAAAKDFVQKAFPRWHGADRESMDVPAAWLTKVVTNHCTDRLTSARVQRESCVGPWLPEPELTTGSAWLISPGCRQARDSSGRRFVRQAIRRPGIRQP